MPQVYSHGAHGSPTGAPVVDRLLPRVNRPHDDVLPRVLRTPAVDAWTADPT